MPNTAPLHVPDIPPTHGPARDDAILSRVTSGHFDRIDWSSVTTTDKEGTRATFLVMSDALRLDGCRVPVSAKLSQQLADTLAATLLTARLADLLYLARKVTLLPSPQPIDSSTLASAQHSARIDAMIAAAPQLGTGDVRQSVGKHWILDNDTLSHGSSSACNYGWHFPGLAFGGSTWEGAVTPGLRLIQGRGWRHDLTHDDYSQTCVLVRRDCLVDGKVTDVRDVMTSAKLAPLLSMQGAMRLVRQAGVSELPPSPAATGGTHAPSPPPTDVQIPLVPIDRRRCPDVVFPVLASVLPWSDAPADVAAWASSLGSAYALGTVIRGVAGGLPAVARIECHGPVLYRPVDPSTGAPLASVPSGWPSA